MFELLSPRQNRPDDRDRGVSEIIGAILIFGLLLLLLVVVQATAVPAWNQQEEFEHSQRVQTDLQTLDAHADAVAADGTARTAVVEAGVRYPSRPFLLNPPPASGTIALTDAGTLEVENGEVVGVDNYWNATQSFDAHALTYEANYREYRNGPTTRYENGVLYNEFDSGATLLLGEHRPVDGRTIDLQMLDGDLSRSSDGSLSLDLRPTSAPARTVSLRSRDGSPLVLRLPTTLDETTLREEVFAGQIDPPGDGVDEPTKYVRSVSTSGGVATITLEGSTPSGDVIEYRFRMSEVGFGATTPEEPAYVTAVGDTSPTVANDSTADLTAEVRDKYNNPVAGVPVTFDVTSGTGNFGPAGTATTVRTGPDGRATVSYETPSASPTTSQITATITGPSSPANTEQWVVTGDASAGGAGGGGSGSGSGPEDAVSSINPGSNPVFPYVGEITVSGSNVNVCFVTDSGTPTWTFSEMRISLYFGGNIESADVNAGSNPSQRLTVAQDYESTASAVGSMGVSSVKPVTFAFNKGTGSGGGVNSGGNQFFILSVRYTGSGQTRTLSYIVPVISTSGGCP